MCVCVGGGGVKLVGALGKYCAVSGWWISGKDRLVWTEDVACAHRNIAAGHDGFGSLSVQGLAVCDVQPPVKSSSSAHLE